MSDTTDPVKRIEDETTVDATRIDDPEVDAAKSEDNVDATRIEDPVPKRKALKERYNDSVNSIRTGFGDSIENGINKAIPPDIAKVEGEALVFFDLIKPIFGLILNFIPEKAWKTTANSVLTKICEIVRDAETATPSDPPISGCEIKMEIVKK
jgi:hypothetical protein